MQDLNEKHTPDHATATDLEAANQASSPSSEEVKSAAIGDTTALSIIRSQQSSRTNESRPSCFKTTAHEITFVLIATLAIAQSSIFIGSTSGITSHIAHDLSMSQSEASWIPAATSLGAGSFLLFFGTVADKFGRRPMLLASMCAYSVFCLVSGFANSPIYMDALCGLIGLCSAAAVPPAVGILGAVYTKPSKRKNMAFACFSAGNPLGFVVGILISGVVYRIASWRTSFYVLSFIYAIFAAASFWAVPVDQQERAKFNMETLKKFDFVGVLLVSSGIALFTTGLTMGNDSPSGWKTPYVLVLLILGPILLGIFIYWEHRFSHPLMPLSIWKDKSLSLLISCMCLGFAGFSGNTFWVSLFFQKVQNVDPLGIAVRMLPQAITGIIVNIVAGLIMHRVSNKLLMGIGALAFTSSFALFSAYDYQVENSYWKFVFPALCFSVIGADFEFTVTNMYVMSSLPPAQQSVAGGIFNTATRLSTSIGLGITTVAYTSQISSNSTNGSSGNTRNQPSTEFLPYRATWWVCLGLSGLSLVFVPFLTVQRPGARRKRNREKVVAAEEPVPERI